MIHMSLAPELCSQYFQHEQWKKGPWLFRVYRGRNPTQLYGDCKKPILNHYKDPCWTTSIMVGNRVFSIVSMMRSKFAPFTPCFCEQESAPCLSGNVHMTCGAVLIKIQTQQKWIFGRTDLLINSIWFATDFNTTKQFWSQSTPLSFFGHLDKLNAGRNYFSCCVWSIGALNRNKCQRKRLRGHHTLPENESMSPSSRHFWVDDVSAFPFGERYYVIVSLESN